MKAPPATGPTPPAGRAPAGRRVPFRRPSRRGALAAVGSAALWLAAGCGDASSPVPAEPDRGGAAPPAVRNAAPPVAPSPPSVPLPVFVDVADASGLVVTNHTGKPAKKDWIVSAMGGGGVAFDADGDGDMDLLVVDGTMLTAEGDLELHDHMRTRLFRNEGGMRFRDVTAESGIDIRAFGFGGAACDYDGDGDSDVFVACWGFNRLLRNRGDGTFEEVAAAAGVQGDVRDMSTSCAWGDVNGDGIHDLYVANYVDQQKVIDDFRKEGRPGRSAEWRGHKVYVGPAGLPAQLDRLYLGNGDGTFRDVSAASLRDQIPRYAFQPVMTDVDNDGDLDVYVANDTQSNYLWVNDGKGVFTDLAVQAGAATSQENAEQAGMGNDAADLNRDGWIDLTVTNFSHDYNTIYLNRTGGRGRLTFTDSSHALGIAKASWLRLAWGVRMFDYDNDGELDHMSACGHVYGEIDGFEASTGTSFRQACQLLRNSGPPAYKLVDVTESSGPGLALKRVWRGMAFADFDDDGDQDVYVAALNERAALLRNDGGERNAFLRFRLVGKGTQRDPSGARVRVHRPDGKVMLEELHHGASFCSDNDPRLFFGCGALERVPKVEVRWPNGEVQTFADVPTRRAFRVEQGRDELLPEPVKAP